MRYEDVVTIVDFLHVGAFDRDAGRVDLGGGLLGKVVVELSYTDLGVAVLQKQSQSLGV